MLYCKNCGAELNDNAAVCTKCGVLVGDGNKFCPNCGAEPDPLAVICVKCGCQLKPMRTNTTSGGMYDKSGWAYPDKETKYGSTHQNNSFAWAIKTCFSKYATFSGRARRKEFWYWCLFTFLSQIVLLGLIGLFAELYVPYYGNVICLYLSNVFTFLFWAWALVIFLPSLAVTVRRLHDTGHSGWYYFIGLIPLVGAIVLLIKFCTDSDGFNKYGPSPKLSKF